MSYIYPKTFMLNTHGDTIPDPNTGDLEVIKVPENIYYISLQPFGELGYADRIAIIFYYYSVYGIDYINRLFNLLNIYGSGELYDMYQTRPKIGVDSAVFNTIKFILESEGELILQRPGDDIINYTIGHTLGESTNVKLNKSTGELLDSDRTYEYKKFSIKSDKRNVFEIEMPDDLYELMGKRSILDLNIDIDNDFVNIQGLFNYLDRSYAPTKEKPILIISVICKPLFAPIFHNQRPQKRITSPLRRSQYKAREKAERQREAAERQREAAERQRERQRLRLQQEAAERQREIQRKAAERQRRRLVLQRIKELKQHGQKMVENIDKRMQRSTRPPVLQYSQPSKQQSTVSFTLPRKSAKRTLNIFNVSQQQQPQKSIRRKPSVSFTLPKPVQKRTLNIFNVNQQE